MVDVISPRQLALLQLVAKHPDLDRGRILAIPGVTPADLAYLEQHDLIREREVGHYRVSHLGGLVLKRSL